MMIFCLLLAGISSPVFSANWEATVVKSLDALVSSCVVIPCSFIHAGGNLPSARLKGIWHRLRNQNERIYHEELEEVEENFRGRTQLLGHLGQKNCTLEISDIKDHDNGPFCFRIELILSATDASPTKKFSYVNDSVDLRMLPEPPKPKVDHPETAIQDHHYTIICSVMHTCPSHRPKLSWSRGTANDVTEIHREIQPGHWELQSILTIIPGEKDDHSEITCTAHFYKITGSLTSSTKLTLYVKRAESYNYIIIPTVVGIGTAVIFSILCIFMVKKYKRRIAELQNQDGSMWNRLSRLSRRIHSSDPRPSHNNQRPSNVNIKSCAVQTVHKPRFPSPKSQPKSCHYKEDLNDDDDYMNTADLNVYGNL